MTENPHNDIEQEFLAAYEEYADAIFRHCLFRVFDRDRAQELTQDTFLRTWESVRSGQEIRNLRAYLYRVANNLVIDEARKRKVRGPSASLETLREETGFDPGEDKRPELEARLEGQKALALLAKLDAPYVEILTLRYVEELEPREIAEQLGVTANVVSVRIHRGLKQLKQLMEEQP
jgi:RNA polymerase sigma-70 factor (ECF subfamily)